MTLLLSCFLFFGCHQKPAAEIPHHPDVSKQYMLHIENKTESPVVVGIFETNCEGHIVGHFVIPGGYPFYTTADVPLSFQDPRPLALCFSPALGKPFVSEIADVTASLNLKSP